jgi:hypothetical protein
VPKRSKNVLRERNEVKKWFGVLKAVGNEFHSTQCNEETTGLPRSLIPRDRHLAAIPEKSGIIYTSRSGSGVYSKLH